jgi:hypothetical protein
MRRRPRAVRDIILVQAAFREFGDGVGEFTNILYIRNIDIASNLLYKTVIVILCDRRDITQKRT